MVLSRLWSAKHVAGGWCNFSISEIVVFVVCDFLSSITTGVKMTGSANDSSLALVRVSMGLITGAYV